MFCYYIVPPDSYFTGINPGKEVDMHECGLYAHLQLLGLFGQRRDGQLDAFARLVTLTDRELSHLHAVVLNLVDKPPACCAGWLASALARTIRAAEASCGPPQSPWGFDAR